MKKIQITKLPKQFLLIILNISFVSVAAIAADRKPITIPALEALIQAKLESDEGIDIQGLVESDLEPTYPGKEKIVQWVVLGPASWKNYLGVFSQQGDHWQELAIYDLDGIMPEKLEPVTPDGVISIDAKTPGSNDPICCPSQMKKLKFRYGKGQLVEVK